MSDREVGGGGREKSSSEYNFLDTIISKEQIL